MVEEILTNREMDKNNLLIHKHLIIRAEVKKPPKRRTETCRVDEAVYFFYQYESFNGTLC